MTSLGRAYIAATTLLVFFVLWAAIAASPWAAAKPDPRFAALARREALVRQAAQAAERAYDARWAGYRRAVAERSATRATPAASPQVRIVQLPPVATTRSS
jgi:hypothetical protein